MIKIGIFAALVMSLTTSAWAMDHRSQYGVGGGLGGNFAAPWAADGFKNAVGTKFPAGSAWARWIAGTPEVGLELSYNYLALSKMDFSANTVILEFLSRQNPWGNFHPLYGFGVGYARTSNKFAMGDAGKWDDPIFKITAGIEFELDDHTDVGLRIDHYSIFRDTNAQFAMHMIAPMLTINHYFGTPAPLPAPAAPAPTAAPTAPTTPAVTAPAAPQVKEEPAKRPTKKAQESAKKKKKKKKKAPSADFSDPNRDR